MPKIEFDEHKTLVLNNVVHKKLPTKEIAYVEKHLAQLLNWAKTKSYNCIGPLIMYSSGIKGLAPNGLPIAQVEILMQLNNSNVVVEHPYRFTPEVRVADCLYSRFVGQSDKLQYANMKIEVFAFENCIELTGETYTVFLKDDNNEISADVFMRRKKTDE